MHLIICAIAITVSWMIRHRWQSSTASWSSRWQTTLVSFVVPPLLLSTTAVSILAMGVQGDMFSLPVSWWGTMLAGGWLGIALGVLGWNSFTAWRSLCHVRQLPTTTLEHQPSRVASTVHLFAGQIGFWSSELVVTDGLMNTLSPSQLQAVIAHEQAHAHYHDTFLFFWLGWLRQLTRWLPNTDALWQELVLLRELRADAWATQIQHIDPLCLAESMLTVARSPAKSQSSWVCGIMASQPASSTHLKERLLALESPQALTNSSTPHYWLWLIGCCCPLLLIFSHG